MSIRYHENKKKRRAQKIRFSGPGVRREEPSMKINRVCTVFFSPTGGTKRVACARINAQWAASNEKRCWFPASASNASHACASVLRMRFALKTRIFSPMSRCCGSIAQPGRKTRFCCRAAFDTSPCWITRFDSFHLPCRQTAFDRRRAPHGSWNRYPPLPPFPPPNASPAAPIRCRASEPKGCGPANFQA